MNMNTSSVWLASIGISYLSCISVQAGEPPLPSGLRPVQAAGLEGSTTGTMPALPMGLDTPVVVESTPDAPPKPFDLTGFVDLRHGHRTNADPGQDNALLSEARLHLKLDGNTVPFHFAADLVADGVNGADNNGVDFELREANIVLQPSRNLDVKLGRQILTWGTGDSLFINDVFPKDYVSFFTGRPDDYLKAPADAVRIGFFSDVANLDLVVMSADDVDRTADGKRLSLGTPTASPPNGVETALRAYRTAGAFELAGYAYQGHWKITAGTDPITRRSIYPELSVYGASLRGPVAGGIFSTELGYYDSRNDRQGTNPDVANSELRFLAGFEHEVAQDTTLGVQYYVTRMADYAAYVDTAPAGSALQDKTRDLVTARLTKRMLNQNLTASAFAFYSPTQKDRYLRLGLSYKPTDAVTLDATLGHFAGPQGTPFGQLDNASNIGLGLRYDF